MHQHRRSRTGRSLAVLAGGAALAVGLLPQQGLAAPAGPGHPNSAPS